MVLKDKVALITGAGGGIGKAIALAFAGEGAEIVLTDFRGAPLEAVAKKVRRRGMSPLALEADVSRGEAVIALVEEALRRFGRIDILVNNAGVRGPTKPVAEVSPEDWEGVLAVNLTGPFLCMKAVLPGMLARRRGKIINISSVAGKRAYPLRSPYCASKWGLIGLTLTAAAELGPHQIQVNAICPGPVEGENIRKVTEERARALGISFEEAHRRVVEACALGRMVGEKEVAALALFLASEAADAITGQAISVCAGYAL